MVKELFPLCLYHFTIYPFFREYSFNKKFEIFFSRSGDIQCLKIPNAISAAKPCITVNSNNNSYSNCKKVTFFYYEANFIFKTKNIFFFPASCKNETIFFK